MTATVPGRPWLGYPGPSGCRCPFVPDDDASGPAALPGGSAHRRRPGQRRIRPGQGRAAHKCGLTFRLESLPSAAGTRLRSAWSTPSLPTPPWTPSWSSCPCRAATIDWPSRTPSRRRVMPTASPAPTRAPVGRHPPPTTCHRPGHAGTDTIGWVSLAGTEAVVIGRSVVVGKPVAMLLLSEHATVTIAHSRTRNLPQ